MSKSTFLHSFHRNLEILRSAPHASKAHCISRIKRMSFGEIFRTYHAARIRCLTTRSNVRDKDPRYLPVGLWQAVSSKKSRSKLAKVLISFKSIEAERHYGLGAALISICVAGAIFLVRARALEAEELTRNGESHATEVSAGIGSTKPRLFRLSDVRQHGPKSSQPWIIHGTGVYDITDWIEAHPGGSVILRAAGDSIDPYWDIFTLHKKQDVYDILEQYRIGEIDPQDLENGKLATKHLQDPFVDDPVRDPKLVTRTERPRNAETPPTELSSFLTPLQTFYVRNHLWVPRIDEKDHGLTIDLGDGSDEVKYSMSDLKEIFTQHKITATLQCSGNRRRHMSENAHEASGLQWDVGAISTAEWSGPLLRDVLQAAGLSTKSPREGVAHAQLTGEDAYGASIPLQKILDPYGDVILACTMNGKPLPRDHGYPIRVLVPGHVAARSVKWVNKITLSDEESTSQWQRRDYKCFGPNCTQGHVNWDQAPAIQETPVQSAVTTLRHRKDDRYLEVRGYAFSGGGRRIVRVDVSVDNGATWEQAELLRDDAFGNKRWSWTLWKYSTDVVKSDVQVVVKAIDEAYNMQPEQHGPTWNFRGNLTTAWHRVPVDVNNKSQS